MDSRTHHLIRSASISAHGHTCIRSKGVVKNMTGSSASAVSRFTVSVSLCVLVLASFANCKVVPSGEIPFATLGTKVKKPSTLTRTTLGVGTSLGGSLYPPTTHSSDGRDLLTLWDPRRVQTANGANTRPTPAEVQTSRHGGSPSPQVMDAVTPGHADLPTEAPPLTRWHNITVNNVTRRIAVEVRPSTGIDEDSVVDVATRVMLFRNANGEWERHELNTSIPLSAAARRFLAENSCPLDLHATERERLGAICAPKKKWRNITPEGCISKHRIRVNVCQGQCFSCHTPHGVPWKKGQTTQDLHISQRHHCCRARRIKIKIFRVTCLDAAGQPHEKEVNVAHATRCACMPSE